MDMVKGYIFTNWIPGKDEKKVRKKSQIGLILGDLVKSMSSWTWNQIMFILHWKEEKNYGGCEPR